MDHAFCYHRFRREYALLFEGLCRLKREAEGELASAADKAREALAQIGEVVDARRDDRHFVERMIAEIRACPLYDAVMPKRGGCLS